MAAEFFNFAKEEYRKVGRLNREKKLAAELRYDEAIESIEETEGEIKGPVSRNRIINWLTKNAYSLATNIKLPKFVQQQIRWYLTESRGDPELIKDVASHHVITHGLEHTLFFLSAAFFDSDLLNVVTGAMTLPGLDPLCYLGFVALRKSSRYRVAYRAVRITVFLMPSYLLRNYSLEQRINWLFAEESRADFVRKQMEKDTDESGPLQRVEMDAAEESVDVEEFTRPRFKYQFRNGLEVFLDMVETEDGFFLERVLLQNFSQLSDLDGVDLAVMKQELKRVFGWNVANILYDIVKSYRRIALTEQSTGWLLKMRSWSLLDPEKTLKAQYSIESLEKQGEVVSVGIRPFAVQSRNRKVPSSSIVQATAQSFNELFSCLRQIASNLP